MADARPGEPIRQVRAHGDASRRGARLPLSVLGLLAVTLLAVLAVAAAL